MHIATLTWYTGNNYGSTMQAYALQQTIKKMGHTSEILAYSPTKLENWKLKIQNHSVKATLDYKINELYVKLSSKEKSNDASNIELFEKFRRENLQISNSYSNANELKKITTQYDAFVCGSDQIWSPYYFNPVYFLSFVKDKRRKIPYAPSFGVEQVPNYSKKRIIKQLKSFEKLSVREHQGAELIMQLTGQNAKVVVDPTLLLSADEWRKLSKPLIEKIEKPYVVCYFLRKNEKYHQVVEKIAKKYGYDIKIIPMVIGDYERKWVVKEPIGPAQWIHLIEHAEMVVTDSFHCTVFSIIFKKNFATFKAFSNNNKRSQNSRIDNLLKITGLEDRVIDYHTTDMLPISAKRLENAEKTLKLWIDESKKWMIEALQDVKKEGKND